MKKTIAKIMAAAMVLSTVVAPNVAQAAISTSEVKAADVVISVNGETYKVVDDGVDQAIAIPVNVTSSALTSMQNKITDAISAGKSSTYEAGTLELEATPAIARRQDCQIRIDHWALIHQRPKPPSGAPPRPAPGSDPGIES